MDAKIKNGLPTQGAVKLRETFLFRVISRLSGGLPGEALAKTDVSRAMLLCLSVWIFVAIVPIGFAEILPEAYQSRATQTNLDETAMLGAGISRGLYERCLAAQVDPLSFAVTGKMGWYLDQSTRTAIDTKIKALVPSYVDTNTVYDGTINITVLTVAGLFAETELDIGDHTSLFTGTPASGTNAATYGDYPWQIYAPCLQERYKVLKAQEKTASVASRLWVEVWQGEGKSSNSYTEAYNEAVDNYNFKTNGYSYSGTLALMQVCKATFWSNATVQGGSGLTNGTGENGQLEYHDVPHHDYIRTDLEVTAVTSGKVTVASSGITNFTYQTYRTNIVITGDGLVPNIVGTYPEISVGYGGFREWGTNGVYIYHAPGNAYYINYIEMGEEWWSGPPTDSPTGLYNPFYSVGGGYWCATGTPFASEQVVEGPMATNPATPIDYSGYYYPIAENVWQGDGGYIFITNGLYTIYGSLVLDTDEAYLTCGTLAGNYAAHNFVATTVVSSDAGGGPPCVGTYVGTTPTWTMGAWSCITNNNGSRYISQGDTNSSWFKSGTDPEGTYSSSGTGTYGSVVATLHEVYSDWVESGVPTYHTPSLITSNGANTVTNTVFYQCWLTKIVCSNDVYSSTNAQHKTGYWVKPALPSAGTGNYWDDQGLGLSADVWNERDVSGWSSATNNPALFGDPVDTVPEDTVEPTVVNAPNCTGFKCTEFKAVVEWNFQYCK